MISLKEKFQQIGGVFLSDADVIADDLTKTSVFIFDWDGVFNDGIKGYERSSGFSEADAMGVNMLRYNYWRIHGKAPLVFIISGENNESAMKFAKREHLHGVYSGYINKQEALEHLAKHHDVSFDRICFIFDDILDLGAAKFCKLSFCIRRNASPLFMDYVIRNKMAAYITGSEGGEHAVREVCELICGLSGEYEKTVTERIDYTEGYQQYLKDRNTVETATEQFKK